MNACHSCGGPVVGRSTPNAHHCIECFLKPERKRRGFDKRKRSVYFTLAHRFVEAAIRYGDLKKLDGTVPCADCAAPATDYDHRDYLHPLKVDPVCRRCNNRRGQGRNAVRTAA